MLLVVNHYINFNCNQKYLPILNHQTFMALISPEDALSVSLMDEKKYQYSKMLVYYKPSN